MHMLEKSLDSDSHFAFILSIVQKALGEDVPWQMLSHEQFGHAVHTQLVEETS